jgi:hypothetical protein
MPDDSKIMRLGLVVAIAIIVVRIALEQAGVPDSINNVFGVAWLYFILPVLFALGIRARKSARPYLNLLKEIVLFALCTRAMVAITYMLAYAFQWQSPRFIYPAGTVGKDVSLWNGIVYIPARNLLIWVVIATVVGMITGSITLLIKRGIASK